MSERPQWFAPKSHGYGSGLPIAWQGWAVLAGYLAVIIGTVPLAGRSLLAHLSVVAVATAILMFVCARTTRGGWKWRSGDDQ